MEYKIAGQVGNGSNTKVYEAYTTTGERFALKILNPISDSLPSEKYLQKKIDLLHEVEVGQKLHHPLIIAPIDGGENEIGVYCVLPYFDTNPSTPNLAKLYPVGTIISPYVVSEIISTIATALQYCHDQGVIHADVKPNNILVGKNGQLKLADFGISVIVGGNDRVSKGPTHFASPEQNRGEICIQSDQYSLACISYLLLTGQHIFEHENKQQLRNMHLNAVPELNKLSPNIEIVLSRALSKSSLQRFNSILEYSQYLSEALRI